jgi:predicted Zn-dependent protease
LKSFREGCQLGIRITLIVALVLSAGALVVARGELPEWIRNAEAGSAVESALFRLMALPGGSVLFRRPPRETRPALGQLIQSQPKNSDLYALRAREGEQQLDFDAAEKDWKNYTANAADPGSAQLLLADFYHRRLRPEDELRVLSQVAQAPPRSDERLTPPSAQRSWQAFERSLVLIRAQALSDALVKQQYRAWLTCYPQEASVYARFLQFLVEHKDFVAASDLITRYHATFPSDGVFPIKAKALVAYRQGSVEQGLAVYEQSFDPLWDAELIKGYFDLLRETRQLRKFLDHARAAVAAHPDDFNAVARVFYYYQQDGRLDAAQEVIAAYRQHKDASGAIWTSQELWLCARLLENINAYPEAARYYYALYNSQGRKDARELALTGLTRILLTAPETSIRLGAGDLSMYRDIGNLDQGPGLLNGILSLLLNTTNPASEYAAAEQRSHSYFNRARAAQLLALLDETFPAAAERSALHARLLEYYASAGESEAVIRSGREFLAAFPKTPERTRISLLMADAYSRAGNSREEYAIYDAALKELADAAQNVPLGTETQNSGVGAPSFNAPPPTADLGNEGGEGEEGEGENDAGGPQPPPTRKNPPAAFQVGRQAATLQVGARSPEYARVLERYLARLAADQQVPAAVGILRREVERNPDDPGLYERLVSFLDQNHLGTEQEEVYRRAIARFPDRSWYHKFARFYLRWKRNAEFEQLSRQVIQAFNGSELESYLDDVGYSGTPGLYLRLNLYAHQRFPHNLAFVHNLLRAYQSPATRDPVAYEKLLREHWFEDAGMESEFFAFLSARGQLEREMQEARSAAGQDAAAFVHDNPAAATLVAEAELWRSHFEQSAPYLKALAEEYPADRGLTLRAASVFRSLAYTEPANTAVAVHLLESAVKANPTDTALLATVGDVYADREQFSRAAPYWNRIPVVEPGEAARYLETASIYWDYFDFDQALRWIGEGRKRSGDNTLYAYQAGAIFENKRDYPHAVQEYLRGALSGEENSAAWNRLLELARRKPLRAAVEAATADIAPGETPAWQAVRLRIALLEAMERQSEVGPWLDGLLQRSSSIELVEQVASLAQQRSLELVRQHALEKQAQLSTDPVVRLQLRYTLAQFYENKKDFTSAQSNVETLYRENPKILGVVRSTADFYWRTKQQEKAIAVLEQAAKDAYPDLARQFKFEAARKSTEAGKFQHARDLLQPLLQAAPYNSEYVAALADTYARAGDDAGLRQLYLDKITAFRQASFSTEERRTRIAELRRGLIPALTRLRQFGPAVDQYIELLNAFPEDEGLASEAALYAQRNAQQAKLVDFYAKTVVQSPRDWRWPVVLARIYTSLENFPAAIEAYGKAVAVRPDRVDLYSARAGLLERLMRFDEAVADYEHLYQLEYKDAKWMEKVAETRARQGRIPEVVTALRTALIDPQPKNPDAYFDAARRLEHWNMLPQALAIAQEGVDVAGSELLAGTRNSADAVLYARIATRLRQPEKALDVLAAARTAAASSLPVLQEQVAREGIAAITDREWRERTVELRRSNALSAWQAALREMGAVVTTYFTPEEKSNLEKLAQSRFGGTVADVNESGVPLAEAAGLAPLEARWRSQLMNAAGPEELRLTRMRAYIALQRRRLAMGSLGGELERFADNLVPSDRNLAWREAAESYRATRDATSELRVRILETQQGTSFDDNRYFELLLAQRPDELVRLAASKGYRAQPAANFAMQHGDAALTHRVIAAFGTARQPVWNRSYQALAGLNFAEKTPAIQTAFVSVLGDQTIGERIGHPVDRAQQHAGSTWFYYGSRYGEYLAVAQQGDAKDFLPAQLEQSPATASAYETLADYYSETAQAKLAIADYQHVLDLGASNNAARLKLASTYFKSGARIEALARWRQVFTSLHVQVDQVRVPENLWTDFAALSSELRARHLFAQFRPEADSLLRGYLHRNGNYRSNQLLHSAYTALEDPPAATTWLLDLAGAAPRPDLVLGEVVDARWIPTKQRGPIFERVVAMREEALAKAEGPAREYADADLHSWQLRWLRHLLHQRELEHARTLLQSVPAEARLARQSEFLPVELQVADQGGKLDALLESYRASAEGPPAPETLRIAAKTLQREGQRSAARKTLELALAIEIERHQLNAPNLLGLAEIRLADGDVTGALQLLRRLVLVVGNPLENLDPAAALLEKTSHPREAIDFLDQLAKAVPWDERVQLRLARTRIAAGVEAEKARDDLATLTGSNEAAYEVRAQAATALAGTRQQVRTGSAELQLLAAGEVPSAAAANQPYFLPARLAAAQKITEEAARVSLLRAAVAEVPRSDEARMQLFRSLAKLQQDEMALLCFQPLLSASWMQARFVSSGEGDSILGDEPEIESSNWIPTARATMANPSEETPGEYPVITTRRAVILSRAQQSELSAELGRAYARRGDLDAALQYLSTARRLAPPASRSALSHDLNAILAEQKLRHENDGRRPLIHDALEQPGIVRPRLLPHAAPSPPLATPKGGVS